MTQHTPQRAPQIQRPHYASKKNAPLQQNTQQPQSAQPARVQKKFHELASALIEKQLMLTQRLLGFLQQEYDVLHLRNVESLDILASQKQPIILDIDTLNQHWLSLLELEGITLDIKNINAFLKTYDAEKNSRILPAWEALLVKAKECQRLNSINGATLTLRNQATQQAMSILQGHTPGDSLYNGRGAETPNYAGGRSLAKA